jgi:hypothetical protein
MLVLVLVNNRYLTNNMDCTKNLDTSIALACNHCGILCIELHILFHPPSCQISLHCLAQLIIEMGSCCLHNLYRVLLVCLLLCAVY